MRERRSGVAVVGRSHRVSPLASRVGIAGLLVAAAAGSPQGSPIPVVPGFVHDGDLSEWRGVEAPRELPAREGEPQVLVWVGQVERGLAVAAEIREPGGAPRLPVGLEVDLADGSPLALPPIGWGHQFGFEALPDAAACGEPDAAPGPCREWYERERAARDRLRALLGRRWRVDVGEAVSVREVSAAPAFEALGARRARAWAPLRPDGVASARLARIAGTEARGVELLVPWEAFPPVRALELSAVRIGVARAARAGEPGPAGAPSPPGPTRRRLGRALAPTLGACGLGPSSVVIPGEADRLGRLPSDAAALYMTPDPSRPLERLVVLDNEARGYQYEPDSTLVSPAAYAIDYPSLRLGPDEWLCGPPLAYRSGERHSPSVDSTRRAGAGPRPPEGVPLVDLRHVETRREDGEGLLVREGPVVRWSAFGSGQCGACPRVSLRMWRIAPDSARIVPLLDYREVAEPGGREIEIEPSADWRSVTIFESSVDWEAEPPRTSWTATRYCRGAEDPRAPYSVCETREDVPEPPLRLRRAYARPDAGRAGVTSPSRPGREVSRAPRGPSRRP